ncbi:MFS transporter [Mumia qirimensis]|uniref:MFS transporter n=1 Tax=Mumia qirimensis TaxID=3234852 RepID=UPI00351CCCD5
MRTSLWSPGFVRLLGVRLGSQLGDGLFQAGLVWLVLLSPEAQRSPERFVGVLVLVLVPFSLLAPFVSLVLDRWPRRNILVWALAARTAVVASVALVAWTTGERATWPVYVLVLVALGLARLTLAGLSASVPHVVPAERLVDANTLGPTLGAGAHTCGLVLGALLVAGGLPSTVVLAAGTVVGVVTLVVARDFGRRALGPDDEIGPPEPRDVVRDLVAAAAHLRSRRTALTALAWFGLLRLLYGGFTLLAFAATAGGGDDAEAAVVATGIAVGFLLGAATTPVAARVVGLRPWSVATGLAGAVLVVVAWAVGGGAVWAWWLQALAFGVVHQSWKIRTDTAVQRTVDEAYLGRSFVLYDVLNNLTYVAGAAVALVLL